MEGEQSLVFFDESSFLVVCDVGESEFWDNDVGVTLIGICFLVWIG